MWFITDLKPLFISSYDQLFKSFTPYKVEATAHSERPISGFESLKEIGIHIFQRLFM